MSSGPTTHRPPTLSVRELSKYFSGVAALQDVSVDFLPGEVHVLFGENGAGKSTLIKVLAGVHHPSGGHVEVDGEHIQIEDPIAARTLGIATVFQDPALVPQLTVEENLELGREPTRSGLLRRATLKSSAREALDRLSCTIDPSTRVAALGRAEQQIVEICRALRDNARVLILDEPTAALTEDESEKLFQMVDRLRSEGMAIIYITHRMQEIRRLGDRVTVLRDGKLIRTCVLAGVDDNELVTWMTGREIGTIFPDVDSVPGDVTVRMHGITSAGLTDVDLEVRAGEIVGIAGLVGGGKDVVGRVLFGVVPHTSGTIELGGTPLPRRVTPHQMIQRGVIYYPADRKRDALVPTATAAKNITLSGLDGWTARGVVRRRAEAASAETIMRELQVRPMAPDALPGTFSGGNQQKLVLGRGRTGDFLVHVFDEPTAGVDVGARADIYRHIVGLAARGAAVLLISSDLPEVLNMSHRVYVVTEGSVVAELGRDQLTEEQVLPHMFPRDRKSIA